MNLYNGLQIIKSGIRRPFVKAELSADAQGDAELLSAMCVDTKVMSARNGRSYWYYFPGTNENIALAKYLLERNGVVPTFRMSRYNTFGRNRCPAFRLSHAYLTRHAKVYAFLKSIQPGVLNAQNQEVWKERLDAVRAQMDAHQK